MVFAAARVAVWGDLVFWMGLSGVRDGRNNGDGRQRRKTATSDGERRCGRRRGRRRPSVTRAVRDSAGGGVGGFDFWVTN